MENKSIFEHAPLRGLIKTTPATSFIGIAILIGCFIVINNMALRYGNDPATRGTILTGMFGLANTVAVFYFASQAIARSKSESEEK